MKFLEDLKLLQEKYHIPSSEILDELCHCGIKISKSNLSHKLNGDRTICEEELQVFIDVIRPSIAEEEKLRDLYKVYLFGESEFEEVKLIKEYIEEFNSTFASLISEQTIPLDNITDISDERLLDTVLYTIISEAWGNTSIKILCQPEYKKLVDILLYFSVNKSSEVQHLVCLSNDFKNDNNLYNIHCLRILDKLVIRNHQHTIRYFYDKVTARFNVLTAFPFFIIANRRVLLISYDFTSGYLLNDEDFARKLSAEFDRMYSQTQELFQIVNNDIDFMQMCAEFERKTRKQFFTLQFHPCVFFNNDARITASCIRDDFLHKNELLDLISTRWNGLNNITGYHIHSSNGTLDFMETGLTTDMSETIFVPVEKKCRNIVMNKIRSNADQLELELNEKFIKIPRPLSIACYDSGIVFISYKDVSESRLIIRERSLYKSMMNFFSYVYKYETKKKTVWDNQI